MSLSGTALVTGASGIVGPAVARMLVERGITVRCTMRAAMKGVQHVVHVAADRRLWARNPAEIVDSNVSGSRNIMEEALRAGVERIVCTGSVATVKPIQVGDPADETSVLEKHQAVGAYKRRKLLAERPVLTKGARGLPVTIVKSSTPIGPRDAKPTPTGRMIVEAASGRVPAFVAAKAERERGDKARPYAEGIRDAIAWFRHAGHLRK
jgi:dihydroflavonol-4-reductase